MAEWKSVGVSRYLGDVYGVEQFVEAKVANQLLALIAFIATLPGCRRLTVNEGRRTRARQRTLRQRFEAYLRGGPWAPLAAVLFTSRHDEVNHGNAADLGGPNGEALNKAEIAALKKYGPDFGIQFTGLTFSPPEPWHVEGDGTTPVPEYAKGVVSAGGGAVVIGNPSTPETPLPETDPDMSVVYGHPHGTQAAASPGSWQILDRKTAPAAILEAGRQPVAVPAEEWDSLRDRWLHRGDPNIYALTDGPNRDKWFVLGEGVFFELNGRNNAEYQSRLGTRIPVTDAEFVTLKAIKGF